mgnify:FL=1
MKEAGTFGQGLDRLEENGNAIQCWLPLEFVPALTQENRSKCNSSRRRRAKKAIGTKAFALEQGDRFLAWDYCYLKIKGAVLGSAEESSLQAISERTGHDDRWAYKVINNLQRRLKEK